MADTEKNTQRKKEKTPFIYRALRLLYGGFLSLIYRTKAHNADAVPTSGGCILAINHLAVADVFIIGFLMKRRIRFLGKKELFSLPLIGRAVEAAGAIRIDRGGSDVAALKRAIACAENGELVAIFPQGHRYPGQNPAATPYKDGVGMIALHAACPVVPVCIKTKGERYRFLQKTDVFFGAEINPVAVAGEKKGKEAYAAVSKKIYDGICMLGDYRQKEGETK